MGSMPRDLGWAILESPCKGDVDLSLDLVDEERTMIGQEMALVRIIAAVMARIVFHSRRTVVRCNVLDATAKHDQPQLRLDLLIGTRYLRVQFTAPLSQSINPLPRIATSYCSDRVQLCSPATCPAENIDSCATIQPETSTSHPVVAPA